MLLMIENAVGEGLKILGLGMLIVIGMMLFLMGSLYILLPIFRKISAKKENKGKVKEEAPAPAAETASVPEETEDETEIVAAIVASISAYEGKAPTSFKVVSFKRI